MAETQHTPGPWGIEVVPVAIGLASTGYAHRVVIGNRAVTVSHSDHQNYDHISNEPIGDGTYVRHIGHGRREPDLSPSADARLIAAAPELLASCRELREALAGSMRVMFAAGLTDEFIGEMARIGIKDRIGVRADYAIAKAEGK